MNRRDFLTAGVGLMAGGLVSRAGRAAPARRKPNVIILFADDQGYADLRCQGQVDDIKTPNIDRMAAEGVRFTDGYITAPQCSPSRAGLITGRYQQRFGLGHIPDCPLPAAETTLADRMKSAGYMTGMVGKWHLEPNVLSMDWARKHLKKVERTPKGRLRIPFDRLLPYYPQNRGFTEFFKGEWNRYWCNYGLDGKDRKPTGEWIEDKRFRVDVQTDAAVAFINRNHDKPFFLYVAYYAPHTPLGATEEYLARFPGDMPERRRYALAMIAGIDHGAGRIMDALKQHGIEEDTLIFYASDNGAPLKITKPDNPIDTDPGGWDGSLNEPMVGEKGMLSEGGIRVPFVAKWKGTLPEGKVYRKPVISLDFAATAVAVAGLDMPPELDGTNLLPYLTGKKHGAPHDALFWRFWNQTAIRKGKWKYLHVGGKGRYLFDLSTADQEHKNLIDRHPRLARKLHEELLAWANQLQKPGIPDGELNRQEKAWYAHYFQLES